MKAIIYVRVSTRGQEDNASLDSQAKACAQFANSKKFQILETAREVYSGADLHDRPELNRIRARLRNREADVMICYAIDRLSRDVAHLAILTDEFDRAGVELFFVTEDLDKSPEGKLLRSIKGYVGEIERIKIRERTQRGKLAKMQAGHLTVGGMDIFGYRKNKQTGKREIFENEAEIVRRIFDLCCAGESANNIARILQREGVITPQASKGQGHIAKGWHARTIIKILRRPEYKGEAFGNQWRIEKIKGKSGKQWQKALSRPIADQIDLSHTTPAIIEVWQWTEAQKQLDSNSGERTRNNKRFYLLRGLIYCEKCQLRLIPTSSNGRRYYRCDHDAHYETGRCKNSLNADRIEVSVWEQITAFLLQPEVVAYNETNAQASTAPDLIQAEINNLAGQLVKLNAARERLLNLLRSTDDESLVKATQDQLLKDAERRKTVEQTLTALKQQQANQQANQNQIRELRDMFQTHKAALNSLSNPERRELFEHLQLRVIVKPDKSYLLEITAPDDLGVSRTTPAADSRNCVILFSK